MRSTFKCFFSLLTTLLILSSCGQSQTSKLDNLECKKDYAFICKTIENDVYYKNKTSKYSILEYYKSYFVDGYTSIGDAHFLVDNNFYNLSINVIDNKYNYLISSFDIESKNINMIYQFSQEQLIQLSPELKNRKNFQISAYRGYHDEKYIDFILKFTDGIFDICEIEFIFDRTDYSQIYRGLAYPNTYDPDQLVFEQTGALIKTDEANLMYLEINSNTYYFDGDYLDNNCEHYQYIKTNIYPNIDSFSRQLFRQGNQFFLRLAFINKPGDIALDNRQPSKGLVFNVDLESKKLDYCGYTEENSYILSVSNEQSNQLNHFLVKSI